jgi:putative transposase
VFNIFSNGYSKMPNYRRNYVEGGTYFFTLVTHQRRRLFQSALARKLLRESILEIKQKRPFIHFASCLLPDHLHTVWILPRGDSDFSIRWKRIKEEFTNRWLDHGGSEGSVSSSRKSKKERGIWQRRFWEHTIENEADLERCVDYTHWNPRKHGLIARVRDWQWSTFFQFVEKGDYDLDWGGTDPCFGWDDPEWSGE